MSKELTQAVAGKRIAWLMAILAAVMLFATVAQQAKPAHAAVTLPFVGIAAVNPPIAGSQNGAGQVVAGFTTATAFTVGGGITIAITFPTGTTFNSSSAAYTTVGNWTWGGAGVGGGGVATNAVSAPSGTTITFTVTQTVANGAGAVTLTHGPGGVIRWPASATTTASVTVATTLPTDTGTTAAQAIIGVAITSTAGTATVAADNVSSTTISINAAAGSSAGGDIITVTTNVGSFTNIGAAGAATSITTGSATAWTPNPAVAPTANTVAAAPVGAVVATAGQTLVLKSSTVGTATVQVFISSTGFGTGVALSAVQVAFGTAPVLPGAPASVVVTPTATTVANNAANAISVRVLDANGVNVLDGTSVVLQSSSGTWTTCVGTGVGTGVCSTTTTAGVATGTVTGSGVSGTQTITALAGTISGTATVTLVGTTAGGVTLAVRAANPTTGAASSVGGAVYPAICVTFALTCTENILSASVKDTGGSLTPGITVTYSVAPTDGVISFENLTAGVPNGTGGTTAASSASSSILGQARIAIRVSASAIPGTVYTITATAPTATGTTSASVTVTVGDVFVASLPTSTVIITAPDMAIASAGPITVAVTGFNGKVVGDGGAVQLVTSSGAVANIANGTPTGPNPAFTVNGVATFTFISPSTPGPVNATALISTRTTSKTFNVGPVTPPGATEPGTIGAGGLLCFNYSGPTKQVADFAAYFAAGVDGINVQTSTGSFNSWFRALPTAATQTTLTTGDRVCAGGTSTKIFA